MKLLLSAYACMPNVGSEPGVGWRWALELAKHHHVHVITHERFRASIEHYIAANPDVLYPEFSYHDTPLLRYIPFNGATALPKYLVWQFTVMPLARRLQANQNFDLAVHITMCTFRYPSWFGYLGIPFVIGPVGGGESAPRALLAGLPKFERAFEFVRSLLIFTAKVDPLLWLAQRKAKLILTRSPQTSQALPFGLGAKARVFQDIGSDAPELTDCRPRIEVGGALRAVMVTRFLGWKGVHLALLALAQARRQGVEVKLDLVGDGRLQQWLKTLVQSAGIDDAVNFHGQLPHAAVMGVLAGADVFLFPSLHDSGGMAVLEALAQGLPTICLDLGGPAVTVTGECGIVVSTVDADQATVVGRLAAALESLATDETRRMAMGRAALSRARQLSWQRSLDDGRRLFEAYCLKEIPDA